MSPAAVRHLAALLFVLSLAAMAFQAHADTSVDYCGDTDNYTVSVQGVKIEPNPVKRGQEAKFSIFATAGNNITTGKLLIEVEYFGFYVYQETHDLCKETKCPVSTGDFLLCHSQSLPIFTPPGTYTLKMTMFGESGQQLTCISFDFSVGFFADVADS